MNPRAILTPIITREFDLTVKDFRKSPGAATWNHLEDTMFALQWIKTRRDVEIEALASFLLPPLHDSMNADNVIKVIADSMRKEQFELDKDELKASVRKAQRSRK